MAIAEQRQRQEWFHRYRKNRSGEINLTAPNKRSKPTQEAQRHEKKSRKQFGRTIQSSINQIIQKAAGKSSK